MEETNLIGLIKTVWKWKKTILAVTFVCTLLSIIASLMMPNYYKSTSLFYASSQDLAKPMPIGDSDRQVNYYGDDSDNDRLLSIAHSLPLKKYLIDSFDLYAHYKIKKNSATAEHKVRKKLGSLMSIQKSKFGALTLGIEDKNKEMSYKMAKASTDYIDRTASGQWKSSQQTLLDSYAAKIVESESTILVFNDSLSQLKKKYGIFDLVNQSEILLLQQSSIDSRKISIQSKLKSNLIKNNPDSLEFYSSLNEGVNQQSSSINAKIQQFNSGVNEIAGLERQQIQMTRQIALDKERSAQLQASFDSPVSGIIKIEQAEVPVFKSRPRRSIYVIAAFILSFFLMSMYAIIHDTYLRNDQHHPA